MKNNQCENCGNVYDKVFMIRKDGQDHFFDSFECAIHRLAPRCAHCETPIVGHGVEAENDIYCCANCARHHDETELRDRSGLHPQ